MTQRKTGERMQLEVGARGVTWEQGWPPTARAASMVASIMRRRLSSIIMAMLCIDWCVRPSGPVAFVWTCATVTGRICRRQVGQRPSLFSHSVTHALWKVWLQISVVVGDSSSSLKHMTHSPSSAASAAAAGSPLEADSVALGGIVIVISEGPASDAAVVDASDCCCGAGCGGMPIGTASTTATPFISVGGIEVADVSDAVAEAAADMLADCCAVVVRLENGENSASIRRGDSFDLDEGGR